MVEVSPSLWMTPGPLSAEWQDPGIAGNSAAFSPREQGGDVNLEGRRDALQIIQVEGDFARETPGDVLLGCAERPG